MDFGKLPNIEQVDFSLPEDPFRNKEFFSRLAQKSEKFHVYAGCTGWSMKEWVGTVYPQGTKPAGYLKEYGRQFNTIELNTTHYRIPDELTIQKWYAQTPADFRFCPKLPQTISHSKNLGLDTTQIFQFCRAVQGLKDKLGSCFLQLPPYFSPERLDLVERFLLKFPRDIPLALELRHKDWFHGNAGMQLFALMERLSISTVITDVAGRRDVLHMHLTTPQVLIRFVGNNLHATDYQRLDAWVKRLQAWKTLGLQRVFLFCHEPDNLLAPQLAVYLNNYWKDKPDCVIRGPEINKSTGQLKLL